MNKIGRKLGEGRGKGHCSRVIQTGTENMPSSLPRVGWPGGGQRANVIFLFFIYAVPTGTIYLPPGQPWSFPRISFFMEMLWLFRQAFRPHKGHPFMHIKFNLPLFIALLHINGLFCSNLFLPKESFSSPLYYFSDITRETILVSNRRFLPIF